MATDLERAKYRVRHCLLRRAAGEHTVTTTQILRAFASEWGLTLVQQRQLEYAARKLERELSERAAQ